MFPGILIAVPLFVGLSFFASHIQGDKEISNLRERVALDRITIERLVAENNDLTSRLQEMWMYKRDSEEKSSVIRKIEEELGRMNERSCPVLPDEAEKTARAEGGPQ